MVGGTLNNANTLEEIPLQRLCVRSLRRQGLASTVGLAHETHYPLKPPSGLCGIRTRDSEESASLRDPGDGAYPRNAPT